MATVEIAELRRSTTELAGPRLARLQQIALGIGAVGLVLSAIGAVLDLPSFFRAYLYAYLFWIGATAGSLGLLMLHHVTGGGWGFVIRRQLEAATRLLPLMLLLFIPILLGSHAIYEWTHQGWIGAEELARNPLLERKNVYLNLPFFTVRAVLYFAIWMIFAYFLNRWGATQDERADPGIAHRLNLLSAAGLVVYVLVTTLVAVDWLMSIEPHWYSSIIGLLQVVMQGLSALALMLVLLAYLGGDLPLLRELPRGYFRDLGNLLLAFVLLWAYMSFSQYLIIYSGNLLEEIPFYVHRAHGGWGWISLFLIPFHFALPFLVLLVGSNVKKDPRALAKVAGFLILMRFVDLFWWVMPTYPDRRVLSVTLADFGTPLLLGGIWLWFWAQQMKDRLVVPVHDPRIVGNWQEVVTHG